MAEIHSADPRAQRAALAAVAIFFVSGALLLWGLNAGGPAVAHWLRDDPATMVGRARILLLGLALVMAGPPIAAGVYLWRFGRHVVAANRFPPPGARMVQDMLVLTGDPARARGRIAQGAGLIFALAGTAIVLLLLRLATGVAAIGR
jgi:hypothetical protein